MILCPLGKRDRSIDKERKREMKERNTLDAYASLTLTDKMASTECCVVGICYIYARASVRFHKYVRKGYP